MRVSIIQDSILHRLVQCPPCLPPISTAKSAALLTASHPTFPSVSAAKSKTKPSREKSVTGNHKRHKRHKQQGKKEKTFSDSFSLVPFVLLVPFVVKT